VNALAVSPDFGADHTVFTAVSGSGLYKSTDGGDAWARVNENNEIYSLAVSPNYVGDKTVFFGATGQGPSGAHRSQDGGNSWVRIVNGMNNVFVSSLAVSPNYVNDRTLFAGTNGFLFQSNDSGDSWKMTLSSMPFPVQRMLGAIGTMSISPNYDSDGVAFAASGQQIFRRAPGGNWESCDEITSASVLSLAVSPRYATDRTLFAGSNGKGVWMSNNEGSTWVAINDGLSSLNVESLAVTSEPTLTIFAATAQGVYKTTARP
jgi:photosystem II stability/assembly factor-like uncharacterized protein